MPFAAWPAYADDTGDKISGTIIDAALLDAIRADIEADTFVGGISPADIINEVVAARGTMADLDTRLDVSLNPDGTLVALSGLATETQLISQLGQRNLVKNGCFDTYQYLAADALPGGKPGVTNPPEGWAFAGGGVLARCGPGEADGTNLGTGQWAQKVTAAAGAEETVSQVVIPAAEATDHQAQLAGRNVQGYVVYKAAAANAIQLEITDGVNTTTTAWQPAAATPTLLTVSHTLNAAWTSLTITVRIKRNTVVYFGGIGLIVSDLPPTVWPYEPGIWYKGGGVRRLAAFNSLNHSCGVGAYQDVLTYLGGIPANALTQGSAIRLYLNGAWANNANAKALRVYLGTNYITPFSVAAGSAGAVWTAELMIMRATATSAVAWGIVTLNAASGAAPTLYHIAAAFAGGAHDFANNVPLKIGLSGVAGNDITLIHGSIELVKF